MQVLQGSGPWLSELPPVTTPIYGSEEFAASSHWHPLSGNAELASLAQSLTKLKIKLITFCVSVWLSQQYNNIKDRDSHIDFYLLV